MKTGLKKIAVIVGIATLGMAGMAGSAWAQALEKPKITIAVGGKNLLYYLPLTIAEQPGLLQGRRPRRRRSSTSPAARKALQAMVGGSADVVSGAYEHTINMHAKGQPMRAFALQGRAPQIVLGVSNEDDAATTSRRPTSRA